MKNRAAEVSFLAVLSMIRRRRPYILASTIVFTIGSAALAFYLPDRYRSQVLIAAEPAVAQTYMRDSPGRSLLTVQNQLRAIREALWSRPVLESAIREFRLYETAGGQIPEPALEDMKSRIRIQVESEYHFSIGFDGLDRQQVTEVANRLAELFIERASAVRERHVEEEVRFLEEELGRLRDQLAEQNEKIRDYKERSADELPDRLEANLKLLETLEGRLQEVAKDSSQAEADRAAILAEMKELEQSGALEVREPQELAERREKLKELRSRYTENHPEIVRLEAEIKAMEERMSGAAVAGQRSPLYARYTERKAVLEGVELRLQRYRDKRRELDSRAMAYRRRVEAVPKHERALAQLTQAYELTQSQYRALIDRQQEARLAGRLEKGHKGLIFTIVEPARLPSSPYSPQRARLVLMGILAGMGLGLLAAFALEQMDTSFQEVEEVQSFTGLPVLASVPTLPSPREPGSDPEGMEMVVLTRPRSVAAEQYRFLAVRIRELWRQGSLLLGVTSAVGGEGKTTTAINLALEIARQAEGKVLLVDADLRKPVIRKLLRLKSARGLSELLRRPDDDLAGYLVRTDSLYVMPSNVSVEDSAKILGSPAGRSVFSRLRQEFDFIVLDLPPILPVADSYVVAGVVDGLVLVVRARRTGRELFQRALDGLEGANFLGVVLNDVDFKHSRYAYAYEYYQKHYLAG